MRGNGNRIPERLEVLREMTPSEVRAAVDGFSARYVADWESWLDTPTLQRPDLFGKILRRWQATRPRPPRRLRCEAYHAGPFLDDLLESAKRPLALLGDVTTLTIALGTTQQQDGALAALWAIFAELPVTGAASCVGITKAVLLLTDGRVGPALDSRVRRKLGVRGPAKCISCDGWLQILRGVGDDVAAFESAAGPLAEVVSPRFAHLEYGRLYDMAMGPR